MNGWRRWLVHGANLAVGGTGLVYAWMVYVLEPSDPWAVIGHPWQPTVQHLHVLAAAGLVFALGLIWDAHVMRRWREGRGGRRVRASGVALALAAAPVVVSGYALQVTVSEGWREAWGWLHLGTGLAWVAFTLAHLPIPGAGRAAARPAFPRAGRAAPAGPGAGRSGGGPGPGTPS